MAQTLHINAKVVTGDILSRRHQGEAEIALVTGAVLTPTAWDYVRKHRLQVNRGGGEAAKDLPIADGVGQTESQIVGSGRCDHPDKSCGCRTDEFGSGFVEPSSCHDCAIHKLKKAGKPNSGCQGCNRQQLLQGLVEGGQAADVEELVQQITEQIMARLERD